jgi:tRNA modification GTPase
MPVSAETGSGLQQLVAAIDRVIDEHQLSVEPDLPILTRARHRKALETARTEIVGFREAWTGEKLPVTVAAVHLRTAVSELEELIGSFEIEDVLDRVFSSFCVGK